MREAPRRAAGITRRAALAAAFPLFLRSQPAAGKGVVLERDWARYPDPATEAEVLRLTDPAYESLLPASPARAVTANSSQLLYASTRTGAWQAHLLQLRDGRSRVLTAAAALVPGSLTLSHDDRTALYFDGPSLRSCSLASLREQEIARLGDGATLGAGPVTSPDGLSYYFVEIREGTSELRRLRRPSNQVETLASSPDGILAPSPNPRRAMICWLDQKGALFTATIDGGGQRRVETPEGRVLQALWNPDGQSLLYLHEPAQPGRLTEIREQQLDTRADSLVARTSQFAAFMPNANASVFIGSSRSKASPAVLILLRLTRRELTLCDHRASEPAQTAPVFTPDSQRILFRSDRHGRPALYAMTVDRLLEKTGT